MQHPIKLFEGFKFRASHFIPPAAAPLRSFFIGAMMKKKGNSNRNGARSVKLVQQLIVIPFKQKVIHACNVEDTNGLTPSVAAFHSLPISFWRSASSASACPSFRLPSFSVARILVPPAPPELGRHLMHSVGLSVVERGDRQAVCSLLVVTPPSPD